jgi:hypothetical protein
MNTSHEHLLRVLNDLPVNKSSYITCMRKRLIAEIRKLSTTEWVNYLQDIRLCPQSKEWPVEVVFQLTQGFRLLIKFPVTYPFKGPKYYMEGGHIPYSITIAQALLPKLPSCILPQLTDYLRTPKQTMLKRYLHDSLFYAGKSRQATLLTSKYDNTLSPYQWSPGLSIEKQLPIIGDIMLEVGLMYKTLC